jgi:hypothetical protein
MWKSMINSWTVKISCPGCTGDVEIITSKAKIKPDSAFRLKAGQVNAPAMCLDCRKKLTVRMCQSPANIVILEGWNE